ncbi:MAG: hypothetical protein WC139_07000 [Candidatus Kapaibacterium sp.]
MKTLIILMLMVLPLFAQTNSDTKPTIFYNQQNETYFTTNVQEVVKETGISYAYQSVKVAGYSEAELLQGLLADYPNITENISFAVYRNRCLQRISYVLYGTVDITTAASCGYSTTNEATFIGLLGCNRYAE